VAAPTAVVEEAAANTETGFCQQEPRRKVKTLRASAERFALGPFCIRSTFAGEVTTLLTFVRSCRESQLADW
jgi:hypothetical protein